MKVPARAAAGCLPLLAILAACGSESGRESVAERVTSQLGAGQGLAQATAPLYDDLGSHAYTISTPVPQAQRYFDQGLRLSYAFNHAEAIRAFSQAAQLDPNCAMCYWGIAYAYGPNINAPMDEPSAAAARAAIQEAVARRQHASPSERALIDAMAIRYGAGERTALDSAYARAMGEVVRQFPQDLEAASLYAESLMDLRPWDYWDRDGRPYPGTTELVAQLERVIATNPNHPGACHFYIHAVEAVQPEKAVPCAERLARLMPGAGHLVHMPAHIYIRVGRWADAIEANRHAVHADETYIADQGPEGLYPLFYYPHNYHFLSLAARMAGQSALAIESGRAASAKMDAGVASAVLEAELIVPTGHLTLATFGRWNEVLAEPMPPSELVHATALAHYARGTAFAALGRWDEAAASLQSLQRAIPSAAEGIGVTVLQIADHALQGEIAARRGNLADAERHLRAAATLEDGLPYTEPPYWYHPVRHALGDVLLKAGRAADAEAVFRQDLERFPENGWSLQGLTQALRAQGRAAEAASAEQRFGRAWADADVRLTSSRI